MEKKNNDSNNKLYYTIGEISEMFGVSKSLIRFWETEFDIKLVKTAKGDRRFTQKNIAQIRQIQYLVKDRGFTLEGAKKELVRERERLAIKFKTIETLSFLKASLIKLRDELG